MAREFGGKHSPDGAPNNARPTPINKFRGKKAHNSYIRVKMLFFAPLPMLFAAIGELRAGQINGMLAELGAFATLILSAWLLRDGIRASEAYDARKVARKPAIPRKLFAAILAGIGIGIAAFAGWEIGAIQSIALALLTGGLHMASFGLDPLKSKGLEGQSAFEAERVAKAVAKAEAILTEMLIASKRFRDRALEGRVETLASEIRDMFRAIEEDPRDLTAARKFLGVYLKGARDATLKFAEIYSKQRSTDARNDYETLLVDLETSFANQKQQMLLDNRTDLNVEIEVLRDRLKQEGLRAAE
ncbi:hypothetical protein GCM10007939_11740 [Amylibacter marinus]|uniref:5-bromo-4-chloroindolyl phosphate hydrolysis protein n=1 Tax=Amylibacter marinus TaxID=1475483 RepID=A0ABQ5VU18_9RHOB|nr:5-bromo-4-chloroindolyl phosphate hydrolysis family protein [Amylibacter marinus]GLQ34891.1 hypothetical protein GCM10007939_11740 [Amylibacter marinus]